MKYYVNIPEVLMKYQQEFEDYLVNEKNVSESTLGAYLGDLKEFEQFAQEKRKKDADRCGSADIAAYVMQLSESGKSASTVNRKMSSIRTYFSFLQAEGKISVNPVQGIRSPRIAEKGIEYLSVEEVDAVLAREYGI